MNMVYCNLDVDTDDGTAAAERVNIVFTPGFVVMNPAAEMIDAWIGYRDPDDWVAKLNAALADPTTVDEKRARFAADPSARDAAFLGRLAYGGGDYVTAVDHLTQARQLEPDDPAGPEIDQQIFRAACRAAMAEHDPPFPVARLTAAADAIVDATPPDPAGVVEVAQRMAGAAVHLGSPELVTSYLERAFALTADTADSNLASRRDRLLPLHALYVEHDEARAVELRKQSLDEGWESDPGGLNSFAWWCFEHRVNLAEAEQLARKGMELAESSSSRANVIDTVAQLVALRGEREEAAELIRQALELEPDNSYLQAQLEKFTGE